MKKYYCLLVLIMSAFTLEAQVINGYANVTNIVGNTLTLSNIDETNATFEDGNSIILMQMQGNVLGDATNTATFGAAGSIGSAGRYEICQILSHTESGGVPTSITLTATTRYTYTTGVNSSVQAITFPKLGSPHYTPTSDIQAKNWDGNTGGVIAFEVAGTLTLARNITADGAGFRGGNRSNDVGTACDGSYFITSTNHTNHGKKGESIYKSTNIDYDYAKGRILNGGGGGNLHNGGGGGGGNFRSGGAGGPGWLNDASTTGCSPSGGGLGGIGLETYVSGSRVFMGGGGGGGQQNNGVGSNGGNGGGIILIKAVQVTTTGSCGITVSANGTNGASGGNDGQGGGGAGGSIVFQVDSWNIAGTCPITVQANGGNGGSVNSTIHGGGGGGGQGLVIYSITTPTLNTTTTSNAGVGGCNNTACTSLAENAIGPNNAGVWGGLNTSLPMQLKYFKGDKINENAVLSWQVEKYIPIDKFEIERSQNGINWTVISAVEANEATLKYQYTDNTPLHTIAYYRLKQIGLKQDINYSNIVAMRFEPTEIQVSIYPNPAKNFIYVEFPSKELYTLKITNTLGQYMPTKITQENNKYILDTNQYKQGVYHLQITNGKQSIIKKIVIQ